MSAFVVGKTHIDYLVAAARRRPYPNYTPAPWGGWGAQHNISAISDPDTIGRLLWQENVRSVTHRYPDTDPDRGNMPGPNGLDRETIATYRFNRLTHVEIVQALKALSCYEYQSCEHPEWQESDARKFCAALRDQLITCLPGYEDADWEIPEPAPPTCRTCKTPSERGDLFCSQCGTRLGYAAREITL